jgi:hypothetical protein
VYTTTIETRYKILTAIVIPILEVDETPVPKRVVFKASPTKNIYRPKEIIITRRYGPTILKKVVKKGLN